MSFEDDVRKKLNDDEKEEKKELLEFENTPAPLNQYESSYQGKDSSVPEVKLKLDEIMKKELKMISLFNKIIGVLMMIQGVLTAIYIIGIPLIFIALKLFNASKAIERLLYSNDENDLREYFIAKGKFSKYSLIYLAVYLVITVLAFFVFIVILAIAANS